MSYVSLIAIQRQLALQELPKVQYPEIHDI